MKTPHSRETCTTDLHADIGLKGEEIEGILDCLFKSLGCLGPIGLPPVGGLRDLPARPAENYDREPSAQRRPRSSLRTCSPLTKSPASASAMASRSSSSSSGLSSTVSSSPDPRTVTMVPSSHGGSP